MKNKHIFLLILAVFAVAGCRIQTDSQPVDNQPADSQDEVVLDDVSIVKEQENNTVVEREIMVENDNNDAEEEIPAFLDYPVPFVPQAPYAVWDELHEEACEEAALILAVKYLQGETLTLHTMEQAILDLVKWEEENGYKIDIDADESLEILDKYFKVKAELVSEVTVERIKRELLAGNLIIVPTAGRDLGNPYFTQPGPVYHMLVIRGYDDNKKEFITNEVGTRRGEAYRYGYDVLLDAVHDWNHGIDKSNKDQAALEIRKQRQVMIIIGK